MKIGFASNDWSRSAVDKNNIPVMGGSGYIRIGQYLEPLRQLGVEVACGTLAYNNATHFFGIHDWNSVNHFDCDVVVMQRFMHKDALRDMTKAVSKGQKILNDLDDWYWGLSPLNAAYKHTHPDFNKIENVNYYKSIIAGCTGVITSTPFLLEKASRWNSNSMLHENYVNMSLFNRREHTDVDKPIVGWMGSTSHRSGDLQILKGVAHQISQIASWHHTGHIEAPNVPKFWEELKIEAGNTTRTSFLPPTELGKGIKFDIGIVPLSRIPFNDAKSWIKGIEYAAAGVPFIASPSQEYKRLHEEHGIGILSKKDADFLKHIKKLRNLDYRLEEEDKNYERVKKLDVNIGAERLLETIKALIA